MQRYMFINRKEALNTWAQPLMESTGIKDPQKLDWMARLAAIKMHADGPINESEQRLVESYGLSSPEGITGMGGAQWPSDPGVGVGATQGAWHNPAYKQGSGDIPTQIMGMAMNTAAYTVGLDLLTVVPVDMPTATFQFVDSVYGGGDLDSKKAPQYLSLHSSSLTNAILKSFTYGQNVFITEPAKADGKAIRGKFVGISQFTGALLFKFEATGDLATAVFTPKAAGSEYTVNEVVADIVAGGAIAPGSTATAADGAAVALADVKIDFVSSIREHIAGASNNDGLTKTGMSRANTELGTDRKVQLKMWSKTTEMKGVEIVADITRVQLRDMKAYGIDGLSMLYKAAQNQLTQTINDEIIDRMAALGVKNHAQMLVSQNLNLNLFIAQAGTANKALTAFVSPFVDPLGNDRKAAFGNVLNAENNSASENLHSRQRRLYSRILAGSNIIGTTSRAGVGDVTVVNSQIASALEDCKGFVSAPAVNTVGTTNDLYFIGTAGRVRVYCNPKWSWDDTRIVMGRKGTEEDAGLKMLAYDLASSVEIIDNGTMAPKISVLSRYELIDAGYYPEASYLTILCDNGFGSWI